MFPRTTQKDGRLSPFERLQDALRDSRHRCSGSVSSKSSHDSKKSQGSDYVAKAKMKVSPPSPESLEEKSYKRKLEIFRSRDSPDVERQMKPPVRPRSKPSNDLVEDQHSDESDDEIKNLTSSNRFTCGMNMGARPVASLAKLFNLGQDGSSNPFGLCFATPVRAASPENIANLSDDKLTTDEFLERHGRSSSPGAPGLLKDSLRESESMSDDYDEVETVNSTLYFESKYNHVIQTRPPMPLFHSQSIVVTPSKTDELAETIRRRSEEYTSRGQTSSSRKKLSPRKKRKEKDPPSPNCVADIMPKIAEF